MEITFLTDNPNSWVIPYVEKLKNILSSSYNITHIFNQKDIVQGDLMFILSCEKIIPKEKLSFHKSNIVIHPSKLPKGKGWSPLAWQILEGKNKIPITLFEASEKVDAGDIYLTDVIKLKGNELNNEIKDKQGKIIISLVLKHLENIKKYSLSNILFKKQKGKETFYPKMTEKDNELNPNKTIKEQFNILRIVDNERYPAFFKLNGDKYFIKIWKK